MDQRHICGEEFFGNVFRDRRPHVLLSVFPEKNYTGNIEKRIKNNITTFNIGGKMKSIEMCVWGVCLSLFLIFGQSMTAIADSNELMATILNFVDSYNNGESAKALESVDMEEADPRGINDAVEFLNYVINMYGNIE